MVLLWWGIAASWPMLELEAAGISAGESRSTVDVDLSAARELLRLGEHAQVVELLTVTVRRAPAAAEAHALLGRALMLERRFRSALPPLQRAVELGARDAPTLLLLGSALWENGELAAAEEVLRGGVESTGGAAPLVQTLGQLLLWQGRYGEAATWLAKAMASEASVGGLLDLARALDGAGRDLEALSAYTRVVELAPEDSRARYGLARLLQLHGQDDAAREHLQVYRRLYEREQEEVRLRGREEAKVARADELMDSGRAWAAVQLLADLPPTPDTLAALGRAYRAAGELEAAIAALERAVALAPQRSDLRAQLQEARRSRSAP